jgi:hypothetical protein
MTHAEIKEWLNERGINGYSGSIGVERVIETLEAFEKYILEQRLNQVNCFTISSRQYP